MMIIFILCLICVTNAYEYKDLFPKIPNELEELIVIGNTKTLSYIEPILPLENCTHYCRSKSWCVFNDGCKFVTDRELLNTMKDSPLASKNYKYQFTDERTILLNIDDNVFKASGEMENVFVDPKRVLNPGVVHGDHPEVTNKKEVLYGEPYHQKSLGMFESAFSKGSLMNAYQGSSSSFFGYPMNGINVRSTNQNTEIVTETFRNSFLETMTCGKHEHEPVIDPSVYKKWDKFQIRDKISDMNVNCLNYHASLDNEIFCTFSHNKTHSYYKMTDFALSSNHDGYSVNAYEYFYGDFIGSLSHHVLDANGGVVCDKSKKSQLWRLVPESNSHCISNWGYNGKYFSPNGENTGRAIFGLESTPVSNVEFGDDMESVEIVIDVVDEDDIDAVKSIYSYNGSEKVYLFCNNNECNWKSTKDQVFVHEQHFASDTESKLPQQKIHPIQTVAVYEIIGGFWEKVGYLANKEGNLRLVKDIQDITARGWRNILQHYPSKNTISNNITTNQFKEDWVKRVEFNTDTLVALFKIVDENQALIFMENGSIISVNIQSGSRTQISPPIISQFFLDKLKVLKHEGNRTLFSTLEYEHFYFVNHHSGLRYNFTHPDAVPDDPAYFSPQVYLDENDNVIIYTYRNIVSDNGKISKITVTDNVNILSEQVITTKPLKNFKVEIENGRILYFEEDGDKGFSKVNYWDGTTKHEDIVRIYSLQKNVDKRFNEIELLYTDMSGDSPKFITSYRSYIKDEEGDLSFPGPVQLISYDGIRTKNITDLGETITGLHFNSFVDYFIINTFGVTYKDGGTIHLPGLSTFDSGSLKLINAKSYGFDEGYIFKGDKVLFVSKDGKAFEVDSIPEPPSVQGENHYFDTRYDIHGNKLFTLVNYKERVLFPDATISIYDSELTTDFSANGQVTLKDNTIELHKDDTLANNNVFVETVHDIPTESDTFKWVDNDCPEDFYVHRVSLGKNMDDFKVGCFKSPGCTLSGNVGLVETDNFQFVTCKHGSVMVGFNKTHIKCQEIVIEDLSPANIPVYHKAGIIAKSEPKHDSTSKRPPDGIQNWVGRPMQKFTLDQSNEKVQNHYYGTECEVSLADARLFNQDNYIIVENKDLDNGENCKLKNAYVTFIECRDKDCRRGFNITCAQAKGCVMRGEDKWYEEMCPAGQVIIGVACVGEDENRPCSIPMFRCREVFYDPSFMPDRPGTSPANNDPSIGEVAKYIIYSLLSIMTLTLLAVLCLCCGSSTDIGSGQERLSSVDPQSRIYNF